MTVSVSPIAICARCVSAKGTASVKSARSSANHARAPPKVMRTLSEDIDVRTCRQSAHRHSDHAGSQTRHRRSKTKTLRSRAREGGTKAVAMRGLLTSQKAIEPHARVSRRGSKDLLAGSTHWSVLRRQSRLAIQEN